MDSLVVDENEVLLIKHYVQFVSGSEHVDWMVEILVFDRVMQMWKICMVVLLSLLRWKPLVEMKMVLYLSFDIKVWDTLFYLPRESDAGVSCMGKLNYYKKKKLWRREKVTKMEGK